MDKPKEIRCKTTNKNVGQFFYWSIIYVLTFTTVEGQSLTMSKTWITKVKSLIPDNYEIKDLKFGHLNNDTLTDAIPIIRRIGGQHPKRPISTSINSNSAKRQLI